MLSILLLLLLVVVVELLRPSIAWLETGRLLLAVVDAVVDAMIMKDCSTQRARVIPFFDAVKILYR